MPKKSGVLIGVAVVVLAVGWVVITVVDTSSDELCQHVSGQFKLNCATPPGGSEIWGPGQVVDPPKWYEVFDGRYGLPTASLFSGSCVYDNRIKPDVAFREDRRLDFRPQKLAASGTASGDLSWIFPKAQNLRMSVGPEWSKVKTVEISAGKAWSSKLDSLKLSDAVKSCNVRPSCIEEIKNKNLEIINSVMIVDDLSYRFETTDGRSVDLSGALNDKFIDITGDAASTIKEEQSNTVSYSAVVGFTTIVSDDLPLEEACSETVVYEKTGYVTTEAKLGEIGIEGFAPISEIARSRIAIDDVGVPVSASNPLRENDQVVATAQASIRETNDYGVAWSSNSQLSPALDGDLETVIKYNGKIVALKRDNTDKLFVINWDIEDDILEVRINDPNEKIIFEDSLYSKGSKSIPVSDDGYYTVIYSRVIEDELVQISSYNEDFGVFTAEIRDAN